MKKNKLETPEQIQTDALMKIATVLGEKIESEMQGNVSRLARESNITTVSIANLRKGENMNPTLSLLIKVFTPLKVKLSELFS